MTDTAPTIEARYSSPKLWRLAVVMGVPAMGFAFLGFSPYVSWDTYRPLIVLGLCTAFCGVLSILFAYLAIVKSGKVAFTVGPAGISDRRISKEVIPWGAIEAISTNPRHPKKGDPIVLLRLKAAQEAQLPITQLARLIRAADRTLADSDGFHLGTGGTDVDYKRLLEVGESYLALAKLAPRDNQ